LRIGFNKKNSIYLPNGYIIKDFLISNKKKYNLLIRKKYKISLKTIIIGHISRYHLMKNTELLIKVFDKIETKKKILLMIIGRDHKISNYLNIFKNRTNKKIIIIKEVIDLNRFISCFDIHISASSKIEGFSNVTAECMLMNVPCIATDVGEAKKILSKFGALVKPNNFLQLFNSINLMIKKKCSKNNAGKFQSRRHIIKNFDMKFFHKNLVKIYDKVK
jgi:glycosyltransferase involved in cell wall biosynthesis